MNEKVRMTKIRTDGGTQSRAELNEAIVMEYCNAMADGAKFPPVVAFNDGNDIWLADGFHRLAAEKRLGYQETFVDMKQGTKSDARWFSCGSNIEHGLRRSSADKRNLISLVFGDPELSGKSDREIARHCGVDHKTVGRVRENLSGEIPQMETRTTTRNGTTYEMDTSNIGRQEEQGDEPIMNDCDNEYRNDDGASSVYDEEEIENEIASGQLKAAKGIREEKARVRREENERARQEIIAQPIIIPDGKYQTIIIDPPWPMKKIERDARPEQFEFDYPVMTEDELQNFPVPDLAADDCHLYLWTTHKFLPMALRLSEHWGFRYQCLLAWIKNVGITPFSWMYSFEPVLFCRRGNLKLEKMGKRLDFNAKVRQHSRKPDEFYDLVKEVSPGPRIDVFSREKRGGFDQFGNDIEKFKGEKHG